ncbi:MAG: hypothetical protein ACPGWR_22950 [Ardenticatenaceae bacterium]
MLREPLAWFTESESHDLPDRVYRIIDDYLPNDDQGMKAFDLIDFDYPYRRNKSQLARTLVAHGYVCRTRHSERPTPHA